MQCLVVRAIRAGRGRGERAGALCVLWARGRGKARAKARSTFFFFLLFFFSLPLLACENDAHTRASFPHTHLHMLHDDQGPAHTGDRAVFWK